jgi:hypothetical protein
MFAILAQHLDALHRMAQSATQFSTIFLSALGVSVALHLWLAHRQVRHVQLHRAAVPAHFAGRITLEAHRGCGLHRGARTPFHRDTLVTPASCLR